MVAEFDVNGNVELAYTFQNGRSTTDQPYNFIALKQQIALETKREVYVISKGLKYGSGTVEYEG
jgi:hypothetical protein